MGRSGEYLLSRHATNSTISLRNPVVQVVRHGSHVMSVVVGTGSSSEVLYIVKHSLTLVIVLFPLTLFT